MVNSTLCCDVRDKEYPYILKHIKQLIKKEGYYWDEAHLDLLKKDGRFSSIGTYIWNLRHSTRPGEKDACLVAKEKEKEVLKNEQ